MTQKRSRNLGLAKFVDRLLNVTRLPDLHVFGIPGDARRQTRKAVKEACEDISKFCAQYRVPLLDWSLPAVQRYQNTYQLLTDIAGEPFKPGKGDFLRLIIHTRRDGAEHNRGHWSRNRNALREFRADAALDGQEQPSKQPEGYVNYEQIATESRFSKNSKNPSRSTIQRWEKKHPTKKARVHGSKADYWLAQWVDERIAEWNQTA